MHLQGSSKIPQVSCRDCFEQPYTEANVCKFKGKYLQDCNGSGAFPISSWKSFGVYFHRRVDATTDFRNHQIRNKDEKLMEIFSRLTCSQQFLELND